MTVLEGFYRRRWQNMSDYSYQYAARESFVRINTHRTAWAQVSSGRCGSFPPPTPSLKVPGSEVQVLPRNWRLRLPPHLHLSRPGFEGPDLDLGLVLVSVTQAGEFPQSCTSLRRPWWMCVSCGVTTETRKRGARRQPPSLKTLPLSHTHQQKKRIGQYTTSHLSHTHTQRKELLLRSFSDDCWGSFSSQLMDSDSELFQIKILQNKTRWRYLLIQYEYKAVKSFEITTFDKKSSKLYQDLSLRHCQDRFCNLFGRSCLFSI